MTAFPFCRRLFAALGLCMLALGVTRAQDVDATQMIGGALAAVRMIDSGNTGELWDGAAPAAKRRVTRDDFVRQVTQARAPLGAPQQRVWVAVNRQALTDTDPDLAGQYLSIEYETRFSKRAERSARELVSFHLDRDGTWRFSGYVLK